MGGTESLGISGVGQTVLAMLMEPQIWHQPAGSVALKRAQKTGKGLYTPFYLGESCSPALALMPDNSVSPCTPLVPFKLLPRCRSSEGVSLSKSVCGFFKRYCLGLQKFLPLTQSQLGFVARSCGDLPFWNWNSGLGLFAPKISLQNFYPRHVGVGPTHSTSVPLLPV